jgi:hypothetical protein
MSGPPSFSAEQCRAKAAELLEAARLAVYLDQKPPAIGRSAKENGLALMLTDLLHDAD